MYNFKDVKDKENSGNKYISPGIHKIVDVQIEYIKNDKGESMDVTFTNENGEVNNRKYFPFRFNDSFKDKKGTPISEEEQLKTYLRRLMHQFKYFLGGKSSEENTERFQKMMEKVKSFEDFANILKKGLSVTITKNKSFAYLKFVIDKDNKYTILPNWDGGVASDKAENLSFDPTTEGKRGAPVDKFESSGSISPADIIFDAEDKGESPFKDSSNEPKEKMFWEE